MEEALITAIADLTKHFITLAMVMVGGSVTFMKEVVGVAPTDIRWLRGAWVFFLLSILCGSLGLMGQTGSILEAFSESMKIQIEANVKIWNGFQALALLIGTLLLVVFGWKRLSSLNSED